MVTTQSGCITSKKQELSVLISNISLLTSSQGQPKEIMASPADSIQEPYLAILNLSTFEHIKLCNKEVVGITGSDRYDLTIYM